MTPTITVRQLNTANGLRDPMRGQGLSNFLSDIDAVAQIITQKILLFLGEWWESLSIGTPMFQSILGVANTSAGVGLILRTQILATPYVTDVQNLTVNYSGTTRAYTFSATVITSFGPLQMTNQALPATNAVIG
jgi:hypothetical protein